MSKIMRKIALLAAAALAAVALTACGGDEAEETAGPAPDEVVSEYMMALFSYDEAVCGYVSEAAAERIAESGGGTCEEAIANVARTTFSDEDRAAVGDATFEIVEESEESASVEATLDGEAVTFGLVKEEEEWKVDGGLTP